MSVINKAHSLIGRITMPSNLIGVRDDGQINYTRPIVNSSASSEGSLPQPVGDYISWLDREYHEDTLFEHRPDNYRYDSEGNSTLGDLNELARMVAYRDIALARLPASDELADKRDKALMKALAFSTLTDLEYFHFYLHVQKALFPDEAWSRVYEMSKQSAADQADTLEEILKVQERSVNTGENFSQWTFPMRGSYVHDKSPDPFWQFERFIRHVNGLAVGNTGNKTYKKYTPRENGPEGFTINHFPGPGIVVNKLLSNPFPEGHVRARFLYDDLAVDSTPYQKVNWKYRQLIADSEKDLPDTKFAFFRGFVIVMNTRKMRIKNDGQALIIFNDHFENPSQRLAYLINAQYAEKFLKNPLQDFGPGHMFNHLKYGNPITLNSLKVSAGLNEGATHIQQRGKNRKLHRQIRDAALFGYAQLDLMKEASRIHNLGYYYDHTHDNWYHDPYKPLRDVLRWTVFTQSKNDPNSEAPPLEGPVLFPFPTSQHSVNLDLIRNCGFVGANTVLYHQYATGDTMFFPGDLPFIDREEVELGNRAKWETILGSDGVIDWNNHLDRANKHGANLVFVDPMLRDVGAKVLYSREEE